MINRWVLVLALCACSKGANNNGPDSGAPCDVDTDCPTGAKCEQGSCSDGTCTVDDDCPTGMKCNDQGQCIGGCGGETLDLTYVPPNFIVVLDRSCSMNQQPTGATQTKWASAVAALRKVLTAHATDIDWGLTLFPDISGATCSQDANAVPLGPNNAGPIKTLLTNALQPADALFPDGPCVTNIDTGLQKAALDPALGTKSSYVMLVTDGAQSACTDGGGDAGSETAITNLLASGIKTFVVGFGAGVDAAQLNKFAMLGGAPVAGTTKYYQADTAMQLDQVFKAIAELVVSCEYLVDPAPPDVNQTYVFFENSELVPRDTSHVDGWDYNPATMKVTVYGSYCDRLQNRTVDDVDVVFGCPIAPPL